MPRIFSRFFVHFFREKIQQKKVCRGKLKVSAQKCFEKLFYLEIPRKIPRKKCT
jgi:hypothetical protein